MGKIKERMAVYGICMFLFFMLLFVLFGSNNCYADNAKSWTADADQEIYEGENEETEEDEPEEDKEPSKIEKWVAGMISGLATGINGEFIKLGMSLDQVICGRVGTGDEVAMFSFELVKGNPYGMIAAAVYDIIRSIIYIVMAILLTAMSAKAMYHGGSGQSREQFKSSLAAFFWYYALLYLMPYILDLFLYIRDQILYAVMERLTFLVSGNSGIGTGSLNLIGHYKEAAAATPDITNALMYLGAVCITFFFMFEYAGMAMAMVIMVILFPFMCVKANMQSRAMDGWVCDVFSIVITPVLDMVLVAVPILTGIWFPEMWLLKMVMCGLVIPSRNAAKRVLGLSSAGAGMLNGMMAAMALRSAGGMAKKGVQRVTSIGEAIKNGREDKKRQQYHEDMAKMEAEDLGQSKDRLQDLGLADPQDASTNKDISGLELENARSKEEEIAGRYADIHNFESPDFSTLSHADKAELYKKRSRKYFMSAMAQSAPIVSGAVLGAGLGGTLPAAAAGAGIGSSGSAGGALAGFGTGLFYGPALASQTAGMGSGIAGAGNKATAAAAESLAAQIPGKQRQKAAAANPQYTPDVPGMPQNAGLGDAGNGMPPSDGNAAAGVIVPSGLSAAAGFEMPHNLGVFGHLNAGSSNMYDVNERANQFVSRNFGNISSYLTGRLTEPGFHDEVRHGMQGAVSKAGYGKLSFEGKQQALSYGGAEVFAKSAMKMLEKEGIASDSAEYSQIYNRLLDEIASEKTIRKMAGAVLEREKRILDFVDQDDTE